MTTLNVYSAKLSLGFIRNFWHTFCKYPVLMVECNRCVKPAIECFCAKIQTYVTETMQHHQQGKIDCKIVANNMFSVLFYYACEKATLKSIDPIFEVSDLKDFHSR